MIEVCFLFKINEGNSNNKSYHHPLIIFYSKIMPFLPSELTEKLAWLLHSESCLKMGACFISFLLFSANYRSSRPDVFLGKAFLKICNKFTKNTHAAV